MSDRLLTREERGAVYDALPLDAACGDEQRAFCKAQDAKTLRAIGEWIIAHKTGWWEDSSGRVELITNIIMPDLALQAFLRGEMPGDAP